MDPRLPWTVRVPGEPKTQGSMQPFMVKGQPSMRHPKSTRTARAALQWHLASEWSGDALRIPVIVSALFGFARPESHYGTGRNANTLKASAPLHHTKRRDLDKMARLLGDALVDAGVLADDCYIVHWSARKVWTRTGYTYLTLGDPQ